MADEEQRWLTGRHCREAWAGPEVFILADDYCYPKEQRLKLNKVEDTAVFFLTQHNGFRWCDLNSLLRRPECHVSSIKEEILNPKIHINCTVNLHSIELLHYWQHTIWEVNHPGWRGWEHRNVFEYNIAWELKQLTFHFLLTQDFVRSLCVISMCLFVCSNTRPCNTKLNIPVFPHSYGMYPNPWACGQAKRRIVVKWFTAIRHFWCFIVTT